MNVSYYNKFIVEKNYQKKSLKEFFLSEMERKSEAEESLATLHDIREVINITSVLSQEKLKDIIEGLVNQAMQPVFGEDTRFEIEGKIQRNQPEILLHLDVNGNKVSFKDEEAGGMLDIISFALRIVFWAISPIRNSNTIILDEPGMLELFGQTIKHLSEQLGLQFIIVTHEDQLSDIADKTFYVTKKDGISNVEEVH